MKICSYLIGIFVVFQLGSCTTFKESNGVGDRIKDQAVVVFIPGYYGTALLDKESGSLRHISFGTALFGGPSLALNSKQLGLEDVAEVIPGGVLDKIILPPGFFSINIYGDALDFLEEQFADRVITYSYDWRESVVKGAQGLSRLITKLKKMGVSKIALVAHSNGGLVASYYLRYGDQFLVNAKENWSGAQKIDALVLMAVPFGGTITSFYNMLHGVSFFMEKTPLNATAMASFPSAYELYPPRNFQSFVNVDGSVLGDSFYNTNHWKKREWGLFKKPCESTYAAERLKYTRSMLHNAHLFSNKIRAPLKLDRKAKRKLATLVVNGSKAQSTNIEKTILLPRKSILRLCHQIKTRENLRTS